MKIIGINGSPRGPESRTRKLVQAVLDGAKSAGADVELVDVSRLQIEYCNGCHICYEQGKCINDDDFTELYESMLDSDGIVLGSPNYVNSVTAQMKTMLDRITDAIHCQMFLGKYGCAVSTAGGSGANEVAAYLNRVLLSLGANTVGGVDVVVGTETDTAAMEAAAKKAYDLGRRLVQAIENRETYPEQEKIHADMIEHMVALVTANKDRWPHQYNHWKEAGRIP